MVFRQIRLAIGASTLNSYMGFTPTGRRAYDTNMQQEPDKVLFDGKTTRIGTPAIVYPHCWFGVLLNLPGFGFSTTSTTQIT